jgi:hypothetical protein
VGIRAVPAGEAMVACLIAGASVAVSAAAALTARRRRDQKGKNR